MLKYQIVDAFTDKPIAGNPVAIFFPEAPLSTTTMQRLAREMNLSETTFVSSLRSDGSVVVRIFTPVNELPFAGHPLLGTALSIAIKTGAERFSLATKKGKFGFCISPRGDWSGKSLLEVGRVEMEQPSPIVNAYERAGDLMRALGVSSSTLPVDIYDVGPRHVFIGVADEAELSGIKPDLRQLAEHQDLAAICFCRAVDHWRMRMFSPAYGVAEDAATGSAASPLALHLGRYGVERFGTRITIVQGVEIGRRSEMIGFASSLSEAPAFGAGGNAIRVATGVYANCEAEVSDE